MLGMDFLKEQRCFMNYGEDLIQSDCWWPLFVSSRGLYSMHWESSSQTQSQIAPTGNDCLAFLDGDAHPPDKCQRE